MPATLSIARRPVVVSVTIVVAGALLVLACSSAEDQTGAEATTTTSTRPTVELQPEDGALRTTVDGVADPSGDEPDDVLLVGDSVLVLVADDVARRVSSTLRVDAADCRRIDLATTGECGGFPPGARISSGLDAVRDARAAEQAPPDAAVLVLANNSTISRELVDSVMDATAGIDHVWWVNARIEGFGRQDSNNQILAELDERDPRAGVVDWYGASEGRAWLDDVVHPNEEGQAALASLIEDRLRCGCTG